MNSNLFFMEVRMKKAINAWSMESTLTFEEMFSKAAAAGFEGIELTMDGSEGPHSLTLNSDEKDYALLRELSAKYNLPVISIASGNGGAVGNPANWENCTRVIFKQIEIAKALGAKGILVPPGGMDDTITLNTARKNAIAFFKSIKSDVEKSGIIVGLENVWNGFFLSPYDMASMIDEIGSEYIGAYLDVGNMLAFSNPEYWVEILGERIKLVHIKDYLRNGRINSGGTWTDITKGSGNWQKVVPALRAAGFDGYLAAEVSKRDENLTFDEYYQMVCDQVGSVINY